LQDDAVDLGFSRDINPECRLPVIPRLDLLADDEAPDHRSYAVRTDDYVDRVPRVVRKQDVDTIVAHIQIFDRLGVLDRHAAGEGTIGQYTVEQWSRNAVHAGEIGGAALRLAATCQYAPDKNVQP
jgi:hypothetical protein